MSDTRHQPPDERAGGPLLDFSTAAPLVKTPATALTAHAEQTVVEGARVDADPGRHVAQAGVQAGAQTGGGQIGGGQTRVQAAGKFGPRTGRRDETQKGARLSDGAGVMRAPKSLRSSKRSYRRSILWAAALVHRLSGLLLSIFLPLHFWVIGLALRQNELDDFLRWTRDPWVKLSETALVLLLAVHFIGGLRLLWLEALPWHEHQRRWVTIGGALSIFLASVFLWRALA